MNTKSTPDQYKSKLTELEGGMKVLLDAYEKSYVTAKMNPNNSDYQQQFASIKNGISSILSNMFSMSNNIQSDIQILNTRMSDVNKNIKKEKDTNATLKKQLGIIDNSTHASSHMINDYEFIYEQRYLRNWALVLSGLACIAAIGTVYKQPITLPSPPKVV